jgi:hypothetical protein
MFFNQKRGAPSPAPSGPLAALASGDPRLLQQLLAAGRMSPQAAVPQIPPSGNPALAQVQQMLAAKGNAGDPFTFIHALIAMDQGQFRQMLLLGAGQGGGMGGVY